MFGGLAFLAAGFLLWVTEARADALDEITARGVLLVGTKTDYRPFGSGDASGAIVGFEPDLAQDIAAALKVRLELVPVVSTTRIPMLVEGKLDLIIATMNDTPERRKLVNIVQPGYYASGVNALAPRALHLHVWQQLRRRAVHSYRNATRGSTRVARRAGK